MNILIQENDYIYYTYEIEQSECKSFISFTVYEVYSWEAETKKVIESTYYLDGYAKWDGCIDINLKNDNLHFCSKKELDLHIQVLQSIWSLCSKYINGMNKE